MAILTSVRLLYHFDFNFPNDKRYVSIGFACLPLQSVSTHFLMKCLDLLLLIFVEYFMYPGHQSFT